MKKLILFAAATLWLPVMAFAQQSPADRKNTAVVSRATGHISIDGFLKEADWAQAPSIGAILQREPKESAPATEKTEVRLLYDSEYLYIGVYCYDSAPGGIIGTQMSRDADLSADDKVEILLDTFRDSRNAYYFSTNPLGALVDGIIVENGSLSRDWDAIWDVRTQRAGDGWTAEFAIPFKSLGFRKGSSGWGFNFSRSIKRKIEEDRWASPRLDVQFSQVSQAGEIGGLDAIQQGVGLDVRPYFTGKMIDSPSAAAVTKGDTGLDAFYNITPSLKLTTTYNTDFAETEVDNRQINLTRFPIQFPEKRSFFLENAGVFTFAGAGGGGGQGGPDVIPFFSRRIGLVSGHEVPILAGLKLTGKAGPYDLGVLDVRTRESGAITARNFFAARIKRNIWEQSYIGALVTDGDPARTTSSQTYGADVRLGTSRFLGGKRNFNVSAYYLNAPRPGVNSDHAIFGGGVAYPNDLWNARADWAKIEKNFNPALGFVPRADTNKLNLSVDFSPRPKNFLGVRRMVHQFRFNRFVRLEDGAVESWRFFVAPINYNFNSGERFEFNYGDAFERLFKPYEISKGVVLPPGDYRSDRWRLEIGTSNKRRWIFTNEWGFGTYYSGRANELQGSFQYKVAPNFQSQVTWNETFARLPQGSFVSRVLGVRADYSVSPMLTFFNLIQYDNESRNLGWQTRVRWILRPGREVIVVFNQGWIKDNAATPAFHAADRSLALKAQYTFRF